ncbi:MAG: hypothetical protein ABIT96_08130 [Ferruginibacter sp.]
MKRIAVLSLLLSISFYSVAQNVGIGTTTPNSNAILDLVSVNKTLLLPRVADTTSIAVPAAGMIMYNQQAKAPNFYNGSRWNTVNDPSSNYVPLNGLMTYTVTGTTVGGIAYETGVLSGIDFSQFTFFPVSTGGGGGTVGGSVQKADSLTFYKEFDGNSIPFKRANLGANALPALEIDQYLSNGTKTFSIKLSNVLITSQLSYISEKTGKLTERYTFSAATIGYKDWINNKSFSYNVSARSFGTY